MLLAIDHFLRDASLAQQRHTLQKHDQGLMSTTWRPEYIAQDVHE